MHFIRILELKGMNVIVNEEHVEVATQSILQDLIDQLNLPSTTGIAVAVNNQIIRKDKWGNHLLSENDRILIIKATQGG